MRRMFRILSLCVAAAGVMTAGASAQQPAAGQPELKIGDTAPDFTLKASDGQTYTLSKLRGRAVVLAWFPKAFTSG